MNFDKIIKRSIDLGCSYAKIINISSKTIQIDYELDQTKINEIEDKVAILEIEYLGRCSKVKFSNYDTLIIDKLINYGIKTSKHINKNDIHIINRLETKDKHTFTNRETEKNINYNEIENWFKNQLEDVEQKSKNKVLYASYSTRSIDMILQDSLDILEEQNIYSNCISLITQSDDEGNKIFYKKGVDLNTDIYESLEENSFGVRDSIKTKGTLIGKIKIKSECIAYLVLSLVNLFNAKNILNKRVYSENFHIGYKAFKETLNIIDSPTDENNIRLYNFDYEGNTTKMKYIIKEGYVNDFLNNTKTSSILGGTPGNCFIELDIPDMDINTMNLIIQINEPIENEYDIVINNIDSNKSKVDILLGVMDLYLIGYKVNESCELFEFNLKIEIDEFINKMKPCSDPRWTNSVNVPDICIEI